MKRILCLLVCLAMAAALVACGVEDKEYVPTGGALLMEDETVPQTQPEEGESQYLELAYYPTESLNPFACDSYTNRLLFSLVYQGLFAVDSDYSVEPILCSRFTVSDDMRTYTFYIDDATFSDGSIMTIQDVYDSYLAAKESKYYGGRFAHVLTVQITEDSGISFRLDTAYENFAMLMDIPVVKSGHTKEEMPVGSGPYYFDAADSGLRLRRNMHWWCTSDLLVTTNSIPLTEVDSVLSLRDAFEFSNVGVACSDPCSDSYVEYRCDYELWDCDNGVFLYLACNMESEVFSNEAIRAALTYAIDREGIAETYYRGYAQPASLPASPSSPYYSKQLAQRYSYDLNRFAKTVSDAYMMGAEVKMLVNREDTMRVKVAREIAKVLTDCGLTVILSEVSSRNFQEQLRYATYDLYLGQTRLSPNMDLTPFFRSYGSIRYGGINDEDLYSLCQQALANSGNYYNLHETVMEDGRLCPVLFYRYNVHSTRGLLTGLSPSRDNVFYYSVGKSMADVIS